jgi:hypothetical protein
MTLTSTIWVVLASCSLPWKRRKSLHTEEERRVPSSNVKGWREGVCGVVEAGVGDDTTE